MARPGNISGHGPKIKKIRLRKYSLTGTLCARSAMRPAKTSDPTARELFTLPFVRVNRGQAPSG
jgi:hypothetical protein